MSCACEHNKMARELDRYRRLAKAFARMECATAALYINADGTYGFCLRDESGDKKIVEYITPY